jgi:WD40 repeat protein
VNNGPALALRDWLVSEGWDDLFLDVDPERGIAGGERWERALNEAAHRCEAVLFLVSRAWLKSAWCMKEFHLASKLNKRIFGVMIEDIAIKELPGELTQTWQVVDLAKGSDHAMFRAVLSDGREEHVTFSKSGLSRLKSGLTKAGLDPRFFAWPPENDPGRPPYRGLRPLEAEDAGIFFGREAPIIEALDRLRGLREATPPRFLAILGASGAGKSSFLRAGLLPRLARDDRNFLVLPVIRPERAVISGEAGLLKSLADALGVQGLKQTRSEFKKAVAAGSDAVLALLGRLAEKARMPKLGEGVEPKPPTLIITIDQGEELFRAEGAEESQAFLALMRDLALAPSPSLTLIVTIRSDSYERLQSVPVLEGIHQQTLSLPPLPRGAYQTVIEGPANRLKDTSRALSIEPQLSEALMADIEAGGAKDALPLLAFTLERLYLEHGGDGNLKLAEYHEIGGIGGSIEAAVARAMEAADSDPAVPRDHAARLALMRRALIPWLAGIDPDTRSPRRAIARLSEIPAETRPLVQHLIDQRLLATDVSQAGEQTIEPAHEALLRQWGLLQDWLKEDLAQLSTLEGIQRATRDWLANAKAPDWLAHSAGRLEDAEALTLRPDLAAKLDAADHDYLATCRKIETERKDRELAEAKKLAEAQQQYAEEQHKLAEEQRRNATRTRIGLIAASFLAVVAVGFAYYGLTKANEADTQREVAQKQTAEAENQRATAETAKSRAEESAQEAAKQKQIAEQRAREAVVEARKSNASSQLMEAVFTLGDTPQRSLTQATEAIETLQDLDAARSGLSNFLTVFNVVRELPALDLYQSFSVGHLKFFETQDASVLSSADPAGPAGASPPFSIIGSRSQVAVIDDNGRALGPPIAFLNNDLGANGAVWVTPDSFALATGTWDSRRNIPKRPSHKPINAALRLYDLKGNVKQTLLAGHDAPISSVSVFGRYDGTKIAIAGDRLGRLIVAPLDGKPVKILPTGISREVIRTFSRNFYDLVIVFGGRDDHDRQAKNETLSVKEARRRLAHELGFETSADSGEAEQQETSASQVIFYRGEDSGARCAVRLPDDGYAICEAGGKVSLWSGYNQDEPRSTFTGGQSDLTALTVLPASGAIVTASEDGLVRFWSKDGSLISNGQAMAKSSLSDVRALGTFDKGKKLIGGDATGGPRVWDISDIEGPRAVHQLPDDLAYKYRDIADSYWLDSGNGALPEASLAFARPWKGQDEALQEPTYALQEPTYDYKLSGDGRLLVRMGKSDWINKRAPVNRGFAVADLTSQTRDWLEIHDPALLSLAQVSEKNWVSERNASSIRSGHICILDAAAPPDSSSDEHQFRVSLVDLVHRSVRGQWIAGKKEKISRFDIGIGQHGPLCVALGPQDLHFTDSAGTRSVELDLVKLGFSENSNIDEILTPKEANVVLVKVDEIGTGTTLLKVDTSTQRLLPNRVHFDGDLSIKAVSADGQQLVVAFEGSSRKARGSEVRLLDSNMSTVMFLNQVPPDASGYAFSADGTMLRMVENGIAHETPLGVASILKFARARLRAWARSETYNALSASVGECIDKGDWPRCREILRAARRQFPFDSGFLLKSANASEWSTATQVNAKLALYDNALAADPYNYFAYYMRGMLRLKTGDFTGAKGDFTAMIALPSSIPAFESDGEWGVADPIVNAVNNATMQIRRAQRGDIYRHRAYAYGKLGDWNAALADIGEMDTLGSKGAALEFELEAQAYLSFGKPAEALKSYQQALAAFKKSPDNTRPDVSEAMVKLHSWQSLKSADLLIEIAGLSHRLGSENEAVLAGDEARQALQSARQSSDITGEITQSLLAAEERLSKTLSAAVDP